MNWIPVDKELPKHMQDVRAKNQFGEFKGKVFYVDPRRSMFMGGFTRSNKAFPEHLKNVTHWMKIEPPEDKDG